MATYDLPILGPMTIPGSSGVCFMDSVANQIAEQALPSVGGQLCFVFDCDNAADHGIYGCFNVPQNYVGTPVIVIKGILDGAPGGGDDLAFGIRGMSVADNETADATYNAEDTAQNTDISGWADEDLYLETIALSNFGALAAGDTAFFYFFLDASGSTYAGNFLLTDLIFRYDDA